MPAEMNFDARTVPPASPLDPIPNDTYRVAAVASEVKSTNDGKGKYLELELQVVDGPYKGRKIWDRLNIVNNNAQAQEIAQRQLSAICHATGVLQLKNSSQLHNIPMLAKVIIVTDEKKRYDPKNEVKSYKPIDGAAPAVAAATNTASAPIAAAAPTAAAENTPAWARKAS